MTRSIAVAALSVGALREAQANNGTGIMGPEDGHVDGRAREKPPSNAKDFVGSNNNNSEDQID